MPPSPPVFHDEAAQRFEISLGEADHAFVAYRRSEGRIAFLHTEVPPKHEGKGLGSRLARAALDYARAEGLAVLPRCPFIAAYMQRHPEYLALVPGASQARPGEEA